MNDDQVVAYLESHAPMERFYLFTPQGTDAVSLKFLDASGKPWNLMEDDDATVSAAVAYLRRSGVRDFNDFGELLRYEEQAGPESC